LAGQSPELFASVPESVWHPDWVVHSQAVGTGREVVGYLSRYVFRTALSNKRILADDERGVTFGYTDAKTGCNETLSLAPMAFIARFLAHVLPGGFHKIRYFGWLHPRALKRLLIVQTLLEAALVFKPKPDGIENIPIHLRCERCKRPALTIIKRFPRARPP
ncbi:MAG TPA: transposase, partial [Chthoniobacterales bacterium]